MEIGKHSRKIVELRRAIRQGTLTGDGLLPIEGPILLEEARRSGVEVVDVFFRAGAAPRMNLNGANTYELSSKQFGALQETQHSQGVIATVRPPRFNLADIAAVQPALIAVLARIQDPGNAGAILRIAEAFGATACMTLAETVHLSNGKSVRASAGSLFRLPHVECVQLRDVTEFLKRNDIRMVGTAPGASAVIDEWDWRAPTAVLVGNEGGGLNDEEMNACEAVLRVPHNPIVESLNSAITAAVVLYEAAKQRRSV